MMKRLRSGACAALALGALAGPARAQVDISPQALDHYAYCVEQAKEFDFTRPGEFVHVGERGVTYRCREEVAVAYYNSLGRKLRRPKDEYVANETGAYVLRPITGIGYCWHKVENELRQAVSFWGCDVHIAY